MSRVTTSVLLGVVVAFLSVGPTWVSGQESPQVSPQRGWRWGWGRGKGRGRGSLACAEVVEELTPCISYLQGYRSSPSKQCCDGVAELLDRNDTSSAYEWDTTCWCIKKTLHGIWRYDPGLISRLPANCSSSDNNKPDDGGDTTESDNDDNGGDTTESEDDGPENQELVENENGTDTDSDSDSGTDTDSGTDSDTDDDLRAGANNDDKTESDTESDNDDNGGGGGDNNDDRFNCFWLSEQDKLTLGLNE